MISFRFAFDVPRAGMSILAAASFAALAAPALAQTCAAKSGPRMAALVELYTSEGCNSCPPADRWLSATIPAEANGAPAIALAFHVDYWDRLGWPDRFASRRWTERQSRYAALWRSESVYTPAVVLNGSEFRNWSGASVAVPNGKAAGVLIAKSTDGKTFEIEFRSAEGAAGSWDAHLALLGSGISSKIGAGENGGRNLQHDFVVLGLRDAEMQEQGEAKRSRLTIPSASESGARLAVAVWVTAHDRLAPAQAIGGWLP